MSGVKWEKWSCNQTTVNNTWEQTTSSGNDYVGKKTTYTNRAAIYSIAPSYKFSTTSALYMSGVSTTITYPEDPTEYVGYYGRRIVGTSPSLGSASYVYINQVASITLGDSGYDYTEEIVAIAVPDSYTTTYSKGSTSYGIITAPEGELPEGGTLISGSATSSYCVIKVGSTYYYYVKETS